MSLELCLSRHVLIFTLIQLLCVEPDFRFRLEHLENHPYFFIDSDSEYVTHLISLHPVPNLTPLVSEPTKAHSPSSAPSHHQNPQPIPNSSNPPTSTRNSKPNSTTSSPPNPYATLNLKPFHSCTTGMLKWLRMAATKAKVPRNEGHPGRQT